MENIVSFSQATVEPIMFYALVLLMIPLAFGVIFDRSIIRAGFILIGVFGTISGIFLLLQAQFLAMAQIMIYAVGITLVVVIALMLTNPTLEQDKAPTQAGNRLPAFLIGLLVFATIFLSIRSELWPMAPELIQSDPTKAIGYFLLTFYSLPFEFASILLLAALIGAVMLAKSDRAPVKSNKEEAKALVNSAR